MEQFCEPHFIPPYSSELNGPIETCWSVVKKRVFYKFTKLQLRKEFSRDACIKLVQDEIKSIEPQIFLNLLRSHYGYMQGLIDEAYASWELENKPKSKWPADYNSLCSDDDTLNSNIFKQIIKLSLSSIVLQISWRPPSAL